jgi:endonuclease YncB( thermonuclease family)
MRPLLSILALAMLALPVFPAEAGARVLRGKVVKALDGDSLRVKVGARTRTYNLAGIDAPERRDCYGTKARTRLNRLVRRKAVRLRVVRGRAVEVMRGRRNVNRAMVASGHARAEAGGGRRGARLRKDEARARARARGLHRACAPAGAAPPDGGVPPAPVNPVAGDVTGPAAIAALTATLEGMAFSRSVSSGGSTTNYQLHLCAGGAFRYWSHASYSSGGTFFNVRNESLGQGWTVTDAVVKPDGTRAAALRGTIVSQANNDGPEPVTTPETTARVDFAGGQWYVDGEPVLAEPGAASCAPLLEHG